ncbi:hypothetical protein I5Q34_08940 [Streptomyces sp. AV19]|uniref:hypothetical protein n=1 Tax=Streptomyces sp. AV19 TaxID=2793068 RepID=UPI0018FEF733|nr:hypothetical protein [Streptomyces sp. AV19]MBH1934412.1 hypothetical protein [Streptomyces sp. AV19]MDG4536266.1 hypothetical protein [Streptomyces sp. AV19]
MDGKTGAGHRVLALDWARDRLVTAALGADGTPGAPTDVPVGKGPRALALGADGGRAYVAGYDDGTLSVLAPDGGSTTVELSGAPCAVAAGLHGGQVCVAAWAEDVVHVLDEEGCDDRRVQVGNGPFALASAPESRWVCAAHDKDEAAARVLYIVDVGTPGAPKATRVPMPGPVRAMAVSEDGNVGYAVCDEAGVVVVDLSGAREPTSHPVGPGPWAVAVGGGRIWVADQGTAELWVAALNGTGELGDFTVLPVVRRPSAVLLSPDGTEAHVLSRTTGVLSSVSPAAPAARRDVPVGVLPSGLTTGPDGRYLYVTDQATGKLHTLRVGPAAGNRIAVDTVAEPFGTAVTPDGLWACTADQSANRVAVADLGTATHRGIITLPEGTKAWGIATGPGLACVTSPDTGRLLVLRPPDGDFGTPSTVTPKAIALAEGTQPHGVAVTPDGRYAVTADSGTGTASLIGLQDTWQTIGEDATRCSRPVGLAVDGDTLYVADYAEPGHPENERVSILQRRNSHWTFVRHIEKDTGHFTGPHEMALSAGKDHLYVANYDSRDGQPQVSILRWDGNAWVFKTGIERSDLTQPHGLALSGEEQKTAKLFVSSANQGRIAQFTVVDNSEVTFDCWLTIEHDSGEHVPSSLALSPDGAFLYATRYRAGFVYGAPVPRNRGSETAMTKVDGLEIPGVRGVACHGTDTLYVVGQIGQDAEDKGNFTSVTLDPSRLKAASVSEPEPLPGRPWTIVSDRGNGTLYITAPARKEIIVRGTGVTPVPVGAPGDSRPWEVTCTPDGRYAYVTDCSPKAPSVHWASLATAQRTATLKVGADPVGVACAPDGLRAYVTCAGDKTVSVLRRGPGLTDDTVLTADTTTPLALAVHPHDSYAYRVHEAALHPVKLTGTDDGRPLPVPGALCDVAIHPDGGFAYLSGTLNPSEPALHVVSLENPATPALGTPLPLPGKHMPTAVTLHPQGTHGYAAGVEEDASVLWALTVATAAAPLVTDTFPTPLPAIRSMAMGPGHLYALTAEGADGTALHVLELSVFPSDAPLERPRAKLILPGRPRSVRVHPLGGHAYVSTDDQGVHLIDLTDPARPQWAGTVSAGAGAVAFRADGHGAWLARRERIAGLGLGAPQVLGDAWRLPGTFTPRRLVVSPDGRSVYVTGENSGDLLVLDTASGGVRHTVRAGTALAGLALRPGTAGRRLYVVDAGAPDLVVADMAEHVPVGPALDAGMDVREVVVAAPAEETAS